MLSVAHPQADWALLVRLPGFDVGPPQLNQDQSSIRVAAAHEGSGLFLTALIERVDAATDAVSCRGLYWKKLKRSLLRMTHIQRSERGEMATLEYSIPEYQGIRVDQKHINAYLYRDGLCVNLRLSKAPYDAKEDADLFDDVLASVTIEKRFQEPFR